MQSTARSPKNGKKPHRGDGRANRKQQFTARELRSVATDLQKLTGEVAEIAGSMESGGLRSIGIDGAGTADRGIKELRRFVIKANAGLAESSL